MSPLRWLARLFRPTTTLCRPTRRPFIRPRLETLEDRLTPAGSITFTGASLVDSHGAALPVANVPDIGEEVFVKAQWSTQGLPGNASYEISFSDDGVAFLSKALTSGAGSNSTQNWAWTLGGWYAAPGTHHVTVTASTTDTTYTINSFSFNFTPQSAPDLPQKFIDPMGGTPFKTWIIGNYVDVNPLSPQFNDWMGGPYTYDGHGGHDLGLASFSAMDQGVPVYAAAAGTVTQVVDGNFDRNTDIDSGNPSNYVVIDMGNGWQTLYYHFRTDSILVHVGDTVVAGQVLGLVGSAGDSTAAHLHFEVQHNGDVVEEEYDPTTFWVNPLPYQGTTRAFLDNVITTSLTDAQADFGVSERPVFSNVFSQAANQTLVDWFHGHLLANDSVEWKVYRPDGSEDTALDQSFTVTNARPAAYYLSIPLPSGMDLGQWQLAFNLNGAELFRNKFQVTAAGAGTARVTEGSANDLVANGRTTPMDFGTVAPNSTAPQQTYTIDNIGSGPLTVSNLVLPTGFTLVGSFPTTIAAGGSATFTVAMNTTASGTRIGLLSFSTSDPDTPTYSFNLGGSVSGGNTGAVHGQLFADFNGDGIENGNDSGLVGWSVELLDASNKVVATTTTGNNGYYSFLNLAPGTYHVAQMLPNGFVRTTTAPAAVAVTTSDVLVSPIGDYDNFASLNGTTLTVTGTAGADNVSFALGATDTITLNGFIYSKSASAISTINFNGNGGADVITITDAATNTLVLSPTGGQLTQAGLTLNLTGAPIVYAYGSSSDTAYFTDSPGNDLFIGTSTYSYLSGTGFVEMALGYGSVYAVASHGGYDQAYIFGSTGNDTFYGTPTFSYLQGSNFVTYAGGFQAVYAYGNSSGTHNAYLFASAGNDNFYGTPTFSYMQGANYLNDAVGYNAVYAYSLNGGTANAYLFDGAGSNTFIGTAAYSYLVGTGYVNEAIGFKSVTAYGGNGTDSAVLYDALGNNTFSGQGSIGTMTTATKSYGIAGYGSGDSVNIVSSQGSFDQALISSIVYVLSKTGTWH